MTVRMILEDDKDEEGTSKGTGALDRKASARGEWYKPTP